jgi:hypothetical protein
MRPDDHATTGGADALPNQRAVGAIGVIVIATPPVIIARSHAEPERADLNTGAVRVNAAINLRRGRNRRDEQRSSSDGE